MADHRLRARTQTALLRVPLIRDLLANPLLDGEWYLTEYPDVRAAGMHPATHYALHGIAEGRDPNPLFDTDWYLASYPDVRDTGRSPLDHYLLHGGFEGRDPSPLFSSGSYLALNLDVASSGLNPLLHYLRFGVREGRAPGRPTSYRPPLTLAQPGRVILAAQRVVWDRRRLRRQPVVRPAHSVPAVDVEAVRRVLSDLIEPASVISPQPEPDPALWRDGMTPGGLQAAAVEPSWAAFGSTGAVARLEWLRALGISYFVLPPGARAWLSALEGFWTHLAVRYRPVRSERGYTVYDVRTPRKPGGGPVAAQMRPLIDEFRDRFGRYPSLLDRSSGASLSRALPGLEVTVPPATDSGPTAYADSSIDMVAVPTRDKDALADAQRVAHWAVITVDGRDPPKLDPVITGNRTSRNSCRRNGHHPDLQRSDPPRALPAQPC